MMGFVLELLLDLLLMPFVPDVEPLASRAIKALRGWHLPLIWAVVILVGRASWEVVVTQNGLLALPLAFATVIVMPGLAFVASLAWFHKVVFDRAPEKHVSVGEGNSRSAS